MIRNQNPRVAVVDDDPGAREFVRALLRRENAVVDCFESAEQFLDRAEVHAYDLILCDLFMPGMSGVDLLRELKTRPSMPRFIVVSGAGTVPLAVEAMKAGAIDVLVKPFEIQTLLDAVRKSAVRSTEAGDAEASPRPGSTAPGSAVGTSDTWKSLLSKAQRVAGLSTPVLIRGETGSGKDVLARYIASRGPRAAKPYVCLNSAALPDSLLESELFGHARGAFSGATERRRGLFEEADGGTLFLDEVGTIPFAAQAKLLRALEEGRIRHVGENRTIEVDVRILAATNLNLEAAITRREFREDLYYRLAALVLFIPPLRERRDDILPLAEHFLKEHADPGGRERRLSRQARELLVGYPFPGNVRELRHAIAQAVVFAAGPELTEEDFFFLSSRRDLVPSRGAPASARDAEVRDVTPAELAVALERARGSRVEAARSLGISRSSLYRLLRRFAPDLPNGVTEAN